VEEKILALRRRRRGLAPASLGADPDVVKVLAEQHMERFVLRRNRD
jgi:hypothetical protein